MPMSKFIFDGVNRLFIVRSGITEIDVQVDLYSDWKEVLREGDNTKYLQALSTIGGDPLTLGRTLGDTYFLENGWKIRPYEGENHVLRIDGNLFSRDGSGSVIPTTGNSNVLVESFVSNLVDTAVSQLEITNLQYLIESQRNNSRGYGTIYYVDPVNGLDDNNGLSPDGAFLTIGQALDTAVNGAHDIINIVNKAGGTTVVNENVNITKNDVFIRATTDTILSPLDGTLPTVVMSGDRSSIDGFTFAGSNTGNCIEVWGNNNNIDNVFLNGNANCAIAVYDNVQLNTATISNYNVGVCFTPVSSGQSVIDKVQFAGNQKGIEDVSAGSVNVLSASFRNNTTGVSLDSGNQFMFLGIGTEFTNNTTDYTLSGNFNFASSIRGDAYVERLKQSQWEHPSGTSSSQFEKGFLDILGMARGKIVNSASGVFDIYDQDDSNIIYTLVESGLERVRQ